MNPNELSDLYFRSIENIGLLLDTICEEVDTDVLLDINTALRFIPDLKIMALASPPHLLDHVLEQHHRLERGDDTNIPTAAEMLIAISWAQSEALAMENAPEDSHLLWLYQPFIYEYYESKLPNVSTTREFANIVRKIEQAGWIGGLDAMRLHVAASVAAIEEEYVETGAITRLDPTSDAGRSFFNLLLEYIKDNK